MSYDFNHMLDKIQEFKKDQLDIIIGMTFSLEAWERLKIKFAKISFDEQVYINDLPCYVLAKQQEECIGWYSEEALSIWLLADNSDSIDELPELKSKEST